MSLIEVQHLRKEFPDVTPLKDVNATIERGEVVSIIGPSGTGKSTLLRCLNRLETPTSGHILIDGVDMCDPATDLPAMRRKVGMVFQNFNLFGHMLVVENVMYGPAKLLGLGKQQAYDEALRLLGRVGLKDKALSFPHELSGGQKQRVAIARALAMHPEAILFDGLAGVRLPAVARGAGAGGAIAKFTPHVPEEGEKALLEVDCRDLVEYGADPSQLAHGSDAISDAVIAGYSVLTTPTGGSADDPAVLCYEIG